MACDVRNALLKAAVGMRGEGCLDAVGREGRSGKRELLRREVTESRTQAR